MLLFAFLFYLLMFGFTLCLLTTSWTYRGFWTETLCLLPSQPSRFNIYTKHISIQYLQVYPAHPASVSFFPVTPPWHRPAGAGRWVDGTAHSLSRSRGDAALKAGSGHAAFYFLLTIGSFLHPPKQTLQCFLKCSQQLETKATSVSYWKSPSKAAAFPGPPWVM